MDPQTSQASKATTQIQYVCNKALKSAYFKSCTKGFWRLARTGNVIIHAHKGTLPAVPFTVQSFLPVFAHSKPNQKQNYGFKYNRCLTNYADHRRKDRLDFFLTKNITYNFSQIALFKTINTYFGADCV